MAPWGSPEALLERFSRQTPKNQGRWGPLEGTSCPESADCIVALDTLGIKSLPSNSSSKKIIHLRREPDLVNRFCPLENSRFMDYSGDTFHVATWWISHAYDELINLPYFEKSCLVSTVVSAKWDHRNRFFKKLCSFLDIDAYGGAGIKEFVNSSYKHAVTPFQNKEDGIKNYRYSIALENSAQVNYFTEKIIDCLLLWTIPIYWGCPNISRFFPEHSYYNVSLDSPQEVTDIIKRPIEKKNIEAMREARNLILNKYNIWAAVEGLLK